MGNVNMTESQRELRLLSEATDEGLAISEEGVVVDASVSLAKMMSCDRDDLLGQPIEGLCEPDTWAKLIERLNSDDGTPFQGKAVKRDGDVFPVQIKGVEYHLEDKTLLVVAFSDLTKLKNAEEKLRRSEQRFRLLFNSMLDGFVLHEITCDEQGRPIDCRVLEANPAYGELMGLSASEVVGRSMAAHRPTVEPNWLELYEKVATTGEALRFEKFFPALDVCFEIVSFSPRRGELVTILADVTERKKLEARLRQAAKMEAIGTLASGVAHEINNPINIIMNYAGLILRDGVAREDVETFAREIVTESERIATIVRNLLAFARQEQELHSPARITDIVDTTLSLMKKVLDNDQIVIRVEIPDELPKVRCRQQQIEQVLVNLMTNARYALNERYPGYHEDKILTLVATTIEREGRRYVRTSVEDHGPGIASDVVDRIFDPFFTTKSGGSGTGLGLSVSHGIVDDHRGRLVVESQLGRYTRFKLDLPVYDPDEDWPPRRPARRSTHFRAEKLPLRDAR